MPHIHKYNMTTLLMVAPEHMVSKEGFAATGRAKNKLVTVGTYPFQDWLIRNIDMEGSSRKAIPKANACWAHRSFTIAL
ncbi:hypothetical protein GCM10011516_22310 [Sphingobacterium cellulitidis]|uniref:Uncharacterized protein n=1 Tax=Sphingobacterium cellulitidis TaxID=1768011 RepID=A0A8H9G3G3_9SPHI|nr:hypothetical protein GCM10011516_22310 [Sphingobacterium soli]